MAVKTLQKVDPVAKLVDELGDLELELAKVAPKIARQAALRKALRERYASQPAAKSYEAIGERFIVAVGEKSKEKKVNVAKLFKLAGAKLFLKLVSCTLKALEQAPAEIAAQVIEEEQTGTRSLKVMAKGQQAAA